MSIFIGVISLILFCIFFSLPWFIKDVDFDGSKSRQILIAAALFMIAAAICFR
jgi:hypothetical protein